MHKLHAWKPEPWLSAPSGVVALSSNSSRISSSTVCTGFLSVDLPLRSSRRGGNLNNYLIYNIEAETRYYLEWKSRLSLLSVPSLDLSSEEQLRLYYSTPHSLISVPTHTHIC